jgi:predicted MFS family arabinose efflux permease
MTWVRRVSIVLRMKAAQLSTESADALARAVQVPMETTPVDANIAFAMVPETILCHPCANSFPVYTSASSITGKGFMTKGKGDAGEESRLIAIVLLFVLGILAAATMGKLVPLAADAQREFAVGPGAFGWLISAPAFAAVVGAPMASWLVRRLGDVNALGITLIVAIVSNLAGAGAPTYLVLLLARALEGSGYFGVSITTMALLARLAPHARRERLLGLWITMMPVGFAVALIMAAPLAGSGNWRLVFPVHAGMLLLALLVSRTLPADPNAGRAAPEKFRHAGTPADGVVRRLGGSFAACTALLAVNVVFPSMCAEFYHESAARSALIGSIGGPASAAGGGLLSLLLARWPVSRRWLSWLLVPLIAACVATFCRPSALLVATAGFTVLMFLAGAINSLQVAAIPSLASDPRDIGAATGTVQQFGNVGTVLGPPMVFTATFQPGPWLALGLAVLLCILMRLLMPVVGGPRLAFASALGAAHPDS